MIIAAKEKLCRIFFLRKENQINLLKFRCYLCVGGNFFLESLLSTDPICMYINEQNHYHYIFIMERKKEIKYMTEHTKNEFHLTYSSSNL